MTSYCQPLGLLSIRSAYNCQVFQGGDVYFLKPNVSFPSPHDNCNQYVILYQNVFMLCFPARAKKYPNHLATISTI